MNLNYMRIFGLLAIITWGPLLANGETNLKSLDLKQSSDIKHQLKANSNANDAIDESAEDDYGDNEDEISRARQSRQRNINFVKRNGATYAWGKWEKWSKCSNSCVQIRRRQCMERIQNETVSYVVERSFYPDMRGRTGCFGIVRRYRLCKDEKCKSNSKHLRDEQCAVLNNVAYKGKYYNWLGYEKEHNECELFCRPRGSDIFIAMNQSVTDGTPCEKPAIYYTHYYRSRAICVEGICKAVHSSGAIRPSTTSDSQLKCGSVLCQSVSELFSKAKLNYGYNYITTIPVGAMNVTLKQLSRSDNLLALKTIDDIFLINGNNRASESGIFEYDDDTYDYNREVSTITAKGPLNKAVLLMLLVRGLNTGVKYDYTIPVPSASISEDDEIPMQWNELGQSLDEFNDNNIDGSILTQIQRARDRKRRKFSWKLLGFGQCNRSCGPGVQPPIFRCIREPVAVRYYSPKRCAFIEKPVFSEDIYHCNRGLCPAYWRAGDYSDCNCKEGETEGLRTRFVKCVQEQITGQIEDVAEALCEQEKLPELTETCNCPKAIRRKIYARGPDKTPKVFSRLIGMTAAVRSIYNSSTPLRRHLRDDRVDKTGVWLMSEWSQQECSAECAVGFQHRTIYCDRTQPYTDLCDLRFTPEQKRLCGGHQTHKQLDCRTGVWFASEWSNCTGDCFNLLRKRTVLCISDGIVVEDDACVAALKPKDVTNCTHKDVDYCSPKWHYSEWSECSRTCGEGIQRRYAKCLEFDWKQNSLIESNNCKYLDREPVYGTCNTQKCEVLETAVEAIRDSEPVVAADECTDDFSNCKRINRQRLCKLQYYKTYCCLTCSGF